VLKVDFHDAELDDSAIAVERQQNLTRIRVASMTASKDPDINGVAMMSFNCDGHVLVMDKQTMIRRGDFVGLDDFVLRQQLPWG
jgi:hypothetical protein